MGTVPSSEPDVLSAPDMSLTLAVPLAVLDDPPFGIGHETNIDHISSWVHRKAQAREALCGGAAAVWPELERGEHLSIARATHPAVRLLLTKPLPCSHLVHEYRNSLDYGRVDVMAPAAAAHVGTRDARAFTSHAQKFFIRLCLQGRPLPEKVRESGEGYTLSGKALDPLSAAARQYGFKPSTLEAMGLKTPAAGEGEEGEGKENDGTNVVDPSPADTGTSTSQLHPSGCGFTPLGCSVAPQARCA
eukprot:1179910-Prorocentrum_minimum.AAC.3